MTAKADFGVDSSKTGGRRSYCKPCDRQRGRAYYDAHKERIAAAKTLHAAQVRHQKEFLRSIGYPI